MNVRQLNSLLPPPCDLGAPAKFDSWRQYQEEAILDAVNSPKRFVMMGAPTGTGKTVLAVVTALMHGGRAGYLTSSKALQQQIWDDFSPIGLKTISGQNNYPCIAAGDFGLTGRVMCDDGPCHHGAKCVLKTKGGCWYYDAFRTALGAELYTTNYSFWMTQNRYVEGMGKTAILILDEAHDAVSHLADFLSVTWTERDAAIIKTDILNTEDIDAWRRWAKPLALAKTAELASIFATIKRYQEQGVSIDHSLLRDVAKLKPVVQKLDMIATAAGEWIVELKPEGAKFDPISPAEYAEKWLFAGIEKIILTSATIRPKTGELLGIPADEMDFFEYPSPFPVSHRPVYVLPDMPRMRYDITEPERVKWVTRMDQFMAPRIFERKGIIHSTSYGHRDYVEKNSEYRDFFLWHGKGKVRDAIVKFRESDPPSVLLSPTVTTGYDFPFDACRWQLIAKLPFMTSKDKIIKARRERDKDYDAYYTAQQIVQTCGRPIRGEGDWAETGICDGQAEWFLKKRKLFPQWFLDAVVWCNTMPPPMEAR